MRNEETIFLHGLADDNGVPASVLRHALANLCADSYTMATQDKQATIKTVAQQTAPSVDPATTVIHVSQISAEDDCSDGINLAPGEEWSVICSDTGMYLESNEESTPGIDYAVAGVGSDDDVIIKCEVYGILPNNEPEVHNLQGSGTIPLPLRTVTSSLTFKFKSVTAGGGAFSTLVLSATARVSKSSVAQKGRDGMRDAGVPVGRAKAALFGRVTQIAQTMARGEAKAYTSAQSVKGRGAAAVSKVAADARKGAALQLRGLIASPLLNAAPIIQNLTPKRTDAGESSKGRGLFRGLRLKRRR